MQGTNHPAATLRRAIAVAALLAALVSCARSGSNSQPSVETLRAQPNHQAAIYAPDIPAALAKRIAERIAPVPAASLDVYRKADNKPDYRAYEPSASERELFARYIELLPAKFRSAMESKLLAVCFVENFLGGGMTDFVFGAETDSLYLVLILNPRVLSMSLPDWIAYRDASPYEAAASGIELRSSCPGGDAYEGLLHTLVHEAAHIYDYAQHATPFVEPSLAAIPNEGSRNAAGSAATDFTRGVWESYAKPIAAYAIPRRAETAAYGLGEALPRAVAPEQYRALAKTPFASLYGSGSWAEDFAEAAAWTWLGEKLGIGYEVRIERGGKEEARFAPDSKLWSAERKAAIAEILRP